MPQVQTLVLTPQVVDRTNLPGPKGKISERSKLEIETLLGKTPNVIGAWVTTLEGTEPVNLIYYWGRDQDVTRTMASFYRVLRSKADVMATERQLISLEQTLRQSEEIRAGLIKCEAIALSGTDVRGICYSSLPPFGPNVNIAIIMFIDAPPDAPDFIKIRRTMLRLQLDIFNRDYLGRETWNIES